MENKKILLIEPPFYRFFKDTYSLARYPLSLGYLAGSIKANTGWAVMAYNADFTPNSEAVKASYFATEGYANYLNKRRDLSCGIWQEVKSTIAGYKPAVVGISAKSQNFDSARVVAGIAKGIDKGIITIAGGPHPSMVGRDAMNCPDIDICVMGEGDRTIVELLNAISAKETPERVRGVIYRRDGRIFENEPREFIEDLDSLPFPGDNAPEVLKDYKKYPNTAFKNIFTARGCPYACFFCGSHKIWQRRPRFRSPENVAREVKALLKKGLLSVHFNDDTFGINKKRVESLCGALIRHCPGLRWSCETHVNVIDEDTAPLMKKSGCFAIQLGVESGSDYILQKMRKRFTKEEALAACRLIKRYGIELHAFFLSGTPYETKETLEETVRFMKKIRCDQLDYSIFMPYPGTEAFAFCKDKGLIRGDYDPTLYNHNSPANSFCINLTPEAFRASVSKIEKMVDRRNSLNRVRRIFSPNALWRMREFGILESVRAGAKILSGR